MNTRRSNWIASVIATMLAFLAFSAMDLFADYSAEQNALNYGGYILVALGLFLFVRGLRLS